MAVVSLSPAAACSQAKRAAACCHRYVHLRRLFQAPISTALSLEGGEASARYEHCDNADPNQQQNEGTGPGKDHHSQIGTWESPVRRSSSVSSSTTTSSSSSSFSSPLPPSPRPLMLSSSPWISGGSSSPSISWLPSEARAQTVQGAAELGAQLDVGEPRIAVALSLAASSWVKLSSLSNSIGRLEESAREWRGGGGGLSSRGERAGRIGAAATWPTRRSCGAPHAAAGLRYMSSALVAVPTNGKRVFFVDTLALVRRLEGEGMDVRQAEAITHVITEVLNDSLTNAANTFTSKIEAQRIEMNMEAAIAKFKAEIQSSQDHTAATLMRDSEKLKTDLEKIRSELRYEIDKVTAGQRLDLNLEKARLREELTTQREDNVQLGNRLDREIHTLKTQLEAAKYDVIKYCIGTIVSVTAVGLGLLRILV